MYVPFASPVSISEAERRMRERKRETHAHRDRDRMREKVGGDVLAKKAVQNTFLSKNLSCRRVCIEVVPFL